MRRKSKSESALRRNVTVFVFFFKKPLVSTRLHVTRTRSVFMRIPRTVKCVSRADRISENANSICGGVADFTRARARLRHSDTGRRCCFSQVPLVVLRRPQTDSDVVFTRSPSGRIIILVFFNRFFKKSPPKVGFGHVEIKSKVPIFFFNLPITDHFL